MPEEVLRLTGSGCWDFPPLTDSEITYWETHKHLLKEKGKFLSSLHKELKQSEMKLQEIEKKMKQIPYFLRFIKKIANIETEENIEKTSTEETIQRLKIYIKNVEEDLIKTRPRMGQRATSRSSKSTS